MIVRTIEVGALGTNCYVVYNDGETGALKNCVIIDPGDDAKKINNMIISEELNPSAILLTHGHFDHIGAVRELLEKYPGIKVYAGKNENALLQDPELNLTGRIRRPLTINADRLLEGNEVFNEAGMRFKVISTPGHTVGSVCYLAEAENVLFSGDTLFQGSMGRTDFPTGDEERIFESLRMLALLPDETTVYPGHGAKTSIGEEKRHNPFMK
ncbi:MAG: MBL fold metallo-hydrolase [Lachnospiraceae bacterium]|nr:MBL fold metallo-hydrolase [Lachnospiraceae bacterium]